MIMFEQDPDVPRWGLHLLGGDVPISEFRATGTQRGVAVAEASERSHDSEDRWQASVLAQDPDVPRWGLHLLGGDVPISEFRATGTQRGVAVAEASERSHDSEDLAQDWLGPAVTNLRSGSRDAEVGKRLNHAVPVPLLQPSNTTRGYGSTSRRSEEHTRVKPSFKAFSPKEIQYATNNFSQSLMIGQGGYGKVYKCQLDNWDVAVKILDDQGDQGLKEYIKEMEVLEEMRHENLINLMGTCFKFRALVYEYLPNGSLEDCLKDRPRELTWEVRTRIVYEICTALRFLHANRPEPLVHGDLKPHNVLLGANFKVKLADFGLCRYLTQGENSKAFHQTMHVSGSAGYIDPDYLGSGIVTPGVDVYSLGKTVVKILTGQHPPDVFREVHMAKGRGSFMSIVDPTVRDWPEDVVETLARFALRSIKPDRDCSEFMGSFYSDLEMILDGIDN